MSVKSDRAKRSGTERRAFPVQLEVRAKAGASNVSTIEGYASVTEEPFEMWDWLGPYSEVVRTGAFGKTLAENPQVQLLLNHGGLAMAYTKAGSLRLSEDTTGLHMEADVSTKRHDVGDMLAALEEGSVDEMSFAFRVTRQQWSPDFDQRDILEVDLHRGDVSVVNFGANPATSVGAVRAADFDRLDEADAKALYERLQRRFQPAEAEPVTLSLFQAQAAVLGL
ncbi:HK97 family phage prohead protease [Streptomyces griseorubiginosus]|uniref:HK97 family phage prohead protease n=1 Tax=Streptomyces griseorubiginosus TaxID=67304 RepID=UPI002E8147A2|nr:HK97 family phage prohead protease [Streptomyces griseorubiginosus]WUB45325.1 HK97 family phage prohead protease [Streptomyces griseorubiginosus]WUB53842.1 HK97 family phage prohead protease [Streptomyces griseorubiginosus]